MEVGNLVVAEIELHKSIKTHEPSKPGSRELIPFQIKLLLTCMFRFILMESRLVGSK